MPNSIQQSSVTVNGFFMPELAAVAQEFKQIMQHPEQRGAALCVMQNQDVLIDIWAGFSDRSCSQAWQADTLVNLFSAGKPLAAVALLLLAEQKLLELEAPVADYWPEFANHQKQDITVAQILSHQAALPAIAETLDGPALFDWQSMIQAIENQAPWWTPHADKHGYAPMTFGWLTGELIRRVSGQMPGDFIRQQICEPLGLDLHIGLTEQELPRVSDVSRMKGQGDQAAQRLLETMQHQPHSMTSLAFSNPPSMLTSTNKLEWRTMQQPAANAHGSAAGLAGFYQALIAGKILNPQSLELLLTLQSRGFDQTLLTETSFGLGVMLEQPNNPAAAFGFGSGNFGHPGAGGTLGFANPAQGLSFAFVSNSLGPYLLIDPRAQKLAQTLHQLL